MKPVANLEKKIEKPALMKSMDFSKSRLQNFLNSKMMEKGSRSRDFDNKYKSV